MSLLEKQAKRAADAVERLALAKGKSASEANALADQAFDSVASGRTSPAAAVWSARSGFAAEARDAKEALASVNREARLSEGAWAAAGRGAAGAKKDYGEFARTARGVAEAILPNILVARSIAAAGALKTVLIGLGAAGSIALGGITAAALLGVEVWNKWQRAVDRSFSSFTGWLRDSIERMDDAERSGSRFRDAGLKVGETAKSWEKVGEAADWAAEQIRGGNEAQEAALALATKRIEVARESAELDLRLEYGKKLAASGSDDERETLRAEMDARLSSLGGRSRTAVAEQRAAYARTKLSDLEEPGKAFRDLDASRSSAIADEARWRDHRDALASKVRRHSQDRLGTPGYDAETVAKELEQEYAAADKEAKDAVRQEAAASVIKDATLKAHDLRQRLLDARELVKAEAELAKATEARTAAEQKRAALEKELPKRLDDAKQEVELAEAELSNARKAEKVQAVTSSTSSADLRRRQQERASREEAKQEKAAAKGERQSDAETLGERAVRGVSSVNARDASGSDRTRREIAASAARVRAANDALHDADGATAKDLAELSASLREFADLLKRGPKSGLNAGIAELRREIDQLKSQLRESRN